jgi:hypothetical protein
MIDHRYFAEVSRALHIFREFSFIACAILIFVRVAVCAQTAPVIATGPRVRDKNGL